MMFLNLRFSLASLLAVRTTSLMAITAALCTSLGITSFSTNLGTSHGADYCIMLQTVQNTGISEGGL
jgi:hypothetical protein